MPIIPHKETPAMELFSMEGLTALQVFTILVLVHATSGQTLTVSGPSRARNATNVSLTCVVNVGTANSLQWVENIGLGSTTIYNDDRRFSEESKYLNFEVTSLSSTESVMTIENADVEDDGVYTCRSTSGDTASPLNLVVEAASTLTVTLTSIVTTDNEDMYVATCDAVGGKPVETLVWTLNTVPQTDGTNGNTIVETNPPAIAPLNNTKSVFTFPATLENYGQTLVCQVSGHDITELNGQESTDLNIHTLPSDAGSTVTVDYVTQGTGIIVSCDAQNQPSPTMRNYYIFSNGTLIHESMEEGNQVTVSDPEAGTEYTCMAGNYRGNTTLSAEVTYDPSTPDTLGVGAIIGIVVGVIVLIVIIVLAVLYCKKEECCCFADGGLKSSGSGKKPAGSAVGSSNGSEKNDVEAPLNGVKDVTAEDKINQPVAVQRSQASIQHTANNPGQELYALPERKQPAGGRGGDAPDRGSGPGQNEPQDIFYAALDLSSKAGHTEKHIPKNENDVVVYSSILV